MSTPKSHRFTFCCAATLVLLTLLVLPLLLLAVLILSLSSDEPLAVERSRAPLLLACCSFFSALSFLLPSSGYLLDLFESHAINQLGSQLYPPGVPDSGGSVFAEGAYLGSALLLTDTEKRRCDLTLENEMLILSPSCDSIPALRLPISSFQVLRINYLPTAYHIPFWYAQNCLIFFGALLFVVSAVVQFLALLFFTLIGRCITFSLISLPGINKTAHILWKRGMSPIFRAFHVVLSAGFTVMFLGVLVTLDTSNILAPIDSILLVSLSLCIVAPAVLFLMLTTSLIHTDCTLMIVSRARPPAWGQALLSSLYSTTQPLFTAANESSEFFPESVHILWCGTKKNRDSIALQLAEVSSKGVLGISLAGLRALERAILLKSGIDPTFKTKMYPATSHHGTKGDYTTASVNYAVLKPLCAHSAASFYETFLKDAGPDLIGPASAFVSHAWDESFPALVSSLAIESDRHANGYAPCSPLTLEWLSQFDPPTSIFGMPLRAFALSTSFLESPKLLKRLLVTPSSPEYYWIDVIFKNQYAANAGNPNYRQDTKREFYANIGGPGNVLQVIGRVNSNFFPFSRVWCLWETTMAAATGSNLCLVVAPLTPTDVSEARDLLDADFSSTPFNNYVKSRADRVAMENATARVDADKQEIFSDIRTHSSFDIINSVVRVALIQSFQQMKMRFNLLRLNRFFHYYYGTIWMLFASFSGFGLFLLDKNGNIVFSFPLTLGCWLIPTCIMLYLAPFFPFNIIRNFIAAAFSLFVSLLLTCGGRCKPCGISTEMLMDQAFVLIQNDVEKEASPESVSETGEAVQNSYGSSDTVFARLLGLPGVDNVVLNPLTVAKGQIGKAPFI